MRQVFHGQRVSGAERPVVGFLAADQLSREVVDWHSHEDREGTVLSIPAFLAYHTSHWAILCSPQGKAMSSCCVDVVVKVPSF